MCVELRRFCFNICVPLDSCDLVSDKVVAALAHLSVACVGGNEVNSAGQPAYLDFCLDVAGLITGFVYVIVNTTC